MKWLSKLKYYMVYSVGFWKIVAISLLIVVLITTNLLSNSQELLYNRQAFYISHLVYWLNELEVSHEIVEEGDLLPERQRNNAQTLFWINSAYAGSLDYYRLSFSTLFNEGLIIRSDLAENYWEEIGWICRKFNMLDTKGALTKEDVEFLEELTQACGDVASYFRKFNADFSVLSQEVCDEGFLPIKQLRVRYEALLLDKKD